MLDPDGLVNWRLQILRKIAACDYYQRTFELGGWGGGCLPARPALPIMSLGQENHRRAVWGAAAPPVYIRGIGIGVCSGSRGCVYIYIYIYIISTHMHIYIYRSIYIYIYIYICVYLSSYTYLCVYMYILISGYMCMYLQIRNICLCIYAHTCICIYM